jgi:endonuclease/exonuclease/phosphatase family metal-dependent hydrolase
MLRSLALASALVLLSLTSWGCDSGDDGPSGSVTLMSQNLYLGGDIFAVTQTSNPNQIPGVVGQIYGDALASDFAARAVSIAAAVEAANPHLIGLQEVTTYRTQTPSDYITGNTSANATTVTVDFLAILMAALADRGLNYRVASTSPNADVELPATTDGQTFFDVRYSDADVILARSDVQTSGAVEASFNQLVTVPVGGVDQTFVRGYQHVTATIDGFTFTHLNTHLEVGGAAAIAQQIQAAELINVMRAIDGPIAFTGDINSAADGSTTNSYSQLTGTLTDVGIGTGATCCQASDIRNASSTLTTRIDFVMHRGFKSASNYDVVLDDPASRVSSGGGLLWASDHAGVVATLEY